MSDKRLTFVEMCNGTCRCDGFAFHRGCATCYFTNWESRVESRAKYVFTMEITCEGCSNAVRKVLSKHGDEVSDVDIDLASKRVTVTTTLPSEIIFNTLKKTGKACSLVS